MSNMQLYTEYTKEEPDFTFNTAYHWRALLICCASFNGCSQHVSLIKDPFNSNKTPVYKELETIRTFISFPFTCQFSKAGSSCYNLVRVSNTVLIKGSSSSFLPLVHCNCSNSIFYDDCHNTEPPEHWKVPQKFIANRKTHLFIMTSEFSTTSSFLI